MTEEQRQAKLKEQSNAIYCAYGEFAVNFEHVCGAIHTAITFILNQEGLRNQQVSNILLAGLTAEPLRVIFSSLLAETQKFNAEEKKIVDSVVKRFQLLTEKRNDIIHGTWFVGWASPTDTDFSKVSGFKHHRSNKGASAKSFGFGVEEFESLTREAKALNNIFNRLYGCFLIGQPVIKNFRVGSDGVVSVPE